MTEGRTTVLITGAAGNLGGHLSGRLAAAGVRLRLLEHRTPVSDELSGRENVEVFRGDLARPETLEAPCRGTDAIVHFAGVLFRPRPETFLPTTNLRYFKNLVTAAISSGAGRIVLVSFPHVEGASSPERPATGRLDGRPESVHATTRLEQERFLMEKCAGGGMVPVILRCGMVYGRNVLMVDWARRLLRRRLLAVWPEPTGIHLIQLEDFLAAAEAAALGKDIRGIYHLGDEKPVTLQHFLDRAAGVWGAPRPWRLPLWMIRTAAALCEGTAMLLGTRTPLTRDFITIGTVPYWGDTSRMREDLLPKLKYRSLDEGIETLRP